jgi:hypothetical protein
MTLQAIAGSRDPLLSVRCTSLDNREVTALDERPGLGHLLEHLHAARASGQRPGPLHFRGSYLHRVQHAPKIASAMASR